MNLNRKRLKASSDVEVEVEVDVDFDFDCGSGGFCGSGTRPTLPSFPSPSRANNANPLKRSMPDPGVRLDIQGLLIGPADDCENRFF